jgi:hypothetical protein
MLKRLLFKRMFIPLIAITSIVAGMVGAGQVLAASTTKTLSTNFTLVNFGTSIANVQVSYLKDTGAAWAADAGNTSFTIPANGGQKPVYQYFDTTLTAGQGSAVVSSDQPLGAVVQILARNQTPTSGAYSAYPPASLLYAPLVLRRQPTASGLANSQIIIQNAGTSTLNGVTVKFINSAGVTVYTHAVPAIGPGASNYYDVETDNALAAPFAGAATIDAGAGSVSVVVNVFNGPDTLQTYSAIPSTTLTDSYGVPLFNSRLPNGLSTVVSVQNLSGGAVAAGVVHLDCTAFAGSAAPAALHLTNPATLNNGQSYSFNPVVDLTIPTAWYGACRLTSPGQNTAAIIQMRVIGTGNSAAYEAIPTASTNKTFFAPLVQNRLGNGAATNTTIVNLSATLIAHVTVTFTPSPDYVAAGGSAAVLSTATTIPAGSSLQENNRVPPFMVGATTMPQGWFGTLTVVSSDQPIAGFTQLTNVNNPPGDTFMTFDGFTQP